MEDSNAQSQSIQEARLPFTPWHLGDPWSFWGAWFGGVLAVAIAWPHTLFLISAGTEAYLGLALLHLLLTKKKPGPMPWPIALALLFMLAMAVQVPRATDFAYGWHEFEKKLCWIALPLACWLRPPSRREWEAIAYYFVWAVLLLIPMAYAFAWMRHYLHPEAWYVFEGTSLLYPFELHRVFESMQAVVALLLTLRFGRRFFGRVWPLPAALLLFWHITLASRTGLLTTGLLLVLGFVWLIYKKQYRFAGIMTVAGAAALMLVLTDASTLAKLADLNPNRHLPPPSHVNINDSYATRYYIWKAAWAVLTENPVNTVLGVGTGNVKPVLAAMYARQGYTLGAELQFNAHNQYLQTWLDSGLPGLLLLLAMLAAPAIMSIRRGDWFGVAYSLVWASVISTESMNEVSRCGVGFALFLGIFAAYYARSGPSKSEV